MPVPVGLIAAGLGAGIKIFQGARQRRLANQIVIPDVDYNTSPYAKQILGEATRLKNSKMPGIETATDNILESQSTAAGSIGRNATSGSQALSMMAASQAMTGKSINDLNGKQADYSLAMLNNWNNANEGMIREGDKEYTDDVRKQQMKIAEKNALMGAGTTNSGNGMNDIINGLFMSSLNFGKN